MRDIKPLVSIVIPVYNVERYLRESLDSVLAQTYGEIEVIVINDGSSDNSGKIADEYAKKDKRVLVIHKQNEGVSVAKNLGIKNARGRFITFIDADDYVREDFIGNLVDDMKKYNVSIATTGTEMRSIDEDGDMGIEVYSRYEALEKMFYGTLEKSDNGVQMFSRRLLVKNNVLFDKAKKIGEDFDFFVQSLTHCESVVVDYRRMYYYRPNPTSAMHQKVNEGLMKAVDNFSAIGEVLVQAYPALQKAVDVKKFNDSVSLAMRSYGVRRAWFSEYRNLERNIRGLKWQVLFDNKARTKVRAAAFVYCIFGNRMSTIMLRKIK